MQTKFNLIVARMVNQITVKPDADETAAIIKFMEGTEHDLAEHFYLQNGGTVYQLDKLDTESISVYCPSTDEVFTFEGDILGKFKANKKVYLSID
jgi:hypothetical protein